MQEIKPAVSEPAPLNAQPNPEVSESKNIAPGYLIKLSCLEDKNLNGSFRVDFDGNLHLPYDVKVEAAGVSPAVLKARIAHAYAPFFRTVPAINASIEEKRCWVDVEGLVQKPGEYLVKHGSTLDELIAKAGGLQQAPGAGSFAARYVHIEQPGVMPRLIRLSEYYAGARDLVPAWRGADRVFFQSEGEDAASASAAEKHYVQVLGQVVKPGEYTVEENADFFFYLSKAGGPGQDADLDKIELIRKNGDSKQTTMFKMKDIRSIPKIQGGDILVVHAEKPSNFILNFTSIIGSISTSVLAAAAL